VRDLHGAVARQLEASCGAEGGRWSLRVSGRAPNSPPDLAARSASADTSVQGLRSGDGELVAIVDFAWPELGVFLEFDGKIKYQKLLRAGESPTDVVVREKRREELICRLTGWRCIRIVWADLYRPELTAAAIRALFRPVTATV
jgi:hypothetical protein